MRPFVLILFTVMTQIMAQSQITFLERLDSSIHANNLLLSDSTVKMDELSGVDDEIDPYDFDSSLLSAAIFCAINEYRVRKNRKSLTYNCRLEDIGRNYAEARSRYNFRSPTKGSYRFVKDVRKMRPYFDAGQDLWHALFGCEYTLNYDHRRPYFRDKDESTSHQMVYGKFGDKLDSNYVPETIPLITYRQLALNIAETNLKGSKRRESMSKNQKGMAVYCYVDDKTLNRNKIPMVNVIIVLGANRFN